MATRISCNQCGKDLLGREHVRIEMLNRHSDAISTIPEEMHFCDLYRCLWQYMQELARLYSWEKFITPTSPDPKAGGGEASRANA